MIIRKALGLVVAAVFAVAVLAWAGDASAVDVPKWVAAIYIDGQKSVGLRWQPSPGTTAVKVLRSDKAGQGYVEIAAPAAPQYFDAAVEPGTTYYYVLQAVAGAEVSANSAEKSVVIPGSKKKALVPPVLDNLTAQSSSEFGKTTYKVGLLWQKVPDVVAYNIYRSEVAGKDYALVGSVSEERYVDTTAVEGKTYYYVLTALDSGFQESKYSEEKSVVIEKVVEVKKEKAQQVKHEVVVKPATIVAILPTPEDPPLESFSDFVFHRGEDQAYVVDNIAQKIVIFDGTGKRIKDFGEQGSQPGQFQMPISINVTPDDQLIITDLGRKVVMFFTPAGVFKREFRVDKKLKPEDKSPAIVGAAVASTGEVFVIDNANSHILVYNDKGTEVLRGWGEQTTQKNTGLGTFSTASGILIDSDNRVLLRDYGNARVQVFDMEGKPLFSLGENVKGLVGAFVKAGRALPYQPDKETRQLIVPDNAMGNIQGFDWNTGAYLYTITGPDGKLKFNERADWELGSTNMVDYDAKGRLWISMNLDKKLAIIEFKKK